MHRRAARVHVSLPALPHKPSRASKSPITRSNDVNDLSSPPSSAPPPVRHPQALLFFLGFRIAAVVFYLLCVLISDNFVLNFVCIVLLLALDFWTVKNISGRLLVGLRWWNQVSSGTGAENYPLAML